ncbi:hypothetical protein K7X08_031898 [Anisodus acutangulus]|uniref:Uncharacterized protein n=1 Tax=Anisodus acutangulus TaxID=402998 RepID=A0A9Q1MMJ5_9SOLA|nr:hypothetical protein K7X08_031898 [Anisodus acutangulus]
MLKILRLKGHAILLEGKVREDSSIIAVGEGSGQLLTQPSSFQADEVSASGSGSNAAVNQLGTSPNNRRIPSQSSSNNQDRAGPSDLQSFSESIKSRFSAMSMRHLETLISSLIIVQMQRIFNQELKGLEGEIFLSQQFNIRQYESKHFLLKVDTLASINDLWFASYWICGETLIRQSATLNVACCNKIGGMIVIILSKPCICTIIQK